MRPVNLNPSKERTRTRKSSPGGPLAYIVVGALVAALAGVTLLVLAGNQISERKSEVAQLASEKAVTEARAAKLAAYIQFHSVRNQRVTTVTNLADSRFDWERVMRELSLVLPDDIWLTNLTGTVRPDVAVEGGASVAIRTSAAGPALSLVGCGDSQEAVARFISDLKNIDGVTRVGVQSSQLPSPDNGEGGGGSEPSSGTCQTRQFIAQFEIVVAFDAAPIPASSDEAVEAVAPVETAESTASSEESSSGEEG